MFKIWQPDPTRFCKPNPGPDPPKHPDPKPWPWDIALKCSHICKALTDQIFVKLSESEALAYLKKKEIAAHKNELKYE